MTVAVTEELRRMLFARSHGRCECTTHACSHHIGRCNADLSFEWYAVRRDPDGPDVLSNLVAMCSECQRNARSYVI